MESRGLPVPVDAELKALSRHLSACCGGVSVIKALSAAPSGGACSAVWAAQTLAYRCRTCQKTSSSALCVACFKASDHAGHDFVLYRSPVGGCCDCGDLSSWALEGCCPRHRPGQPASQSLGQVVGPEAADVLRTAVCGNLMHVGLLITRMAALSAQHSRAGGGTADMAPHVIEEQRKLSVECSQRCKWLCELLGNAALRAEVCPLASADLQEVALLFPPPASSPSPPATQPTFAPHSTGPSSHKLALSTDPTPDVGQLALQLYERCMSGNTGLPVLANKPGRQMCWAWVCVAGMVRLPEGALHDVTTLLMLLLYDLPFKEQTARYVMDVYGDALLALAPPVGPGAATMPDDAAGAGPSISSPNPRALGQALDRMTVQLLNSEGVLNTLLHEEDLLGVLLGTLHRVLTRLVYAFNLVGQDRTNAALNTHMAALVGACRRALSDLCSACHHTPVVTHLLTHPGVLRDHFLACLELVQGMVPQTCIQPGLPAALHAHPAVPLAVNLEIVLGLCVREIMSGLLTEGPSTTSSSSLEASRTEELESTTGRAGGGEDSVANALAQASRLSLEGLDNWARDPRCGALRIDPGTAYRALQHGVLDVSPHLPLHRTAAALLQGLLHVEVNGQPGESRAARQHVQDLLHWLASPPSAGPTLSTGRSGERSARALLAMRHPLLLQAWLTQISQRLWVRSDDDSLTVEFACQAYRELTSDLDLLMVLCALASRPSSAALQDMLHILGVGPLLRVSGALPGGAAPGDVDPTSGALSQQHACEDGLRLLVCVLRDRSVAGAPPRARTRQALLYQLAVSDGGHAQLLEALPQDLQGRTQDVEEVLAELCVYRPPALSTPGQYCLRRDAWRQFDPHVLCANRRTLPQALERAYDVGGYKPHWQLQPPALPVPPSLAPGVHGVVIEPALCRLVAAILQHAAVPGARAAWVTEDVVLSACNLAALQLHTAQECLDVLRDTSAQPRVDTQHAQHVVHTVAALLREPSTPPTGYSGCTGLLRLFTQLSGSPATTTSVSTSHAKPGRTQRAAHGSGGGQPSDGARVSADVADCAQYLVSLATGWLDAAAAAAAVPVMPAAPSAPIAIAGAGGEGRAAHGHAPVIATPPGGGGTASGGPLAAADPKERARLRQQAIMEAMRAKQAAFLTQSSSPNVAPSGGGGGSAPVGVRSLSAAAAASPATAAMAATVGGSARTVPGGLASAVAWDSDTEGSDHAGGVAAGTSRSERPGLGSASGLDGPRLSSVSMQSDGAGSSHDDMSEGSSDEDDLWVQDAPMGTGTPPTGFLSTAVSSAPIKSAPSGSLSAAASWQPRPALGTWAHVRGECVVCQTSSTTRGLGPLGVLGHIGVCSSLGCALNPPQTLPFNPDTGAAAGGADAPNPAAAGQGGSGELDVRTGGDTGAAPATANQAWLAWLRAAGAGAAGASCGGVPAGGATSASGAPATSAHASGGGDKGASASRRSSGEAACPPGGAQGVVRDLMQARLVQWGPLTSVVDWQPGLHAHTCGHTMHFTCYQKYRDDVLTAASAASLRQGHPAPSPYRTFPCPACRRLSNCLLPSSSFKWQPGAATPAAAPEHGRASVSVGAAAAGGGKAAEYNVGVQGGAEVAGQKAAPRMAGMEGPGAGQGKDAAHGDDNGWVATEGGEVNSSNLGEAARVANNSTADHVTGGRPATSARAHAPSAEPVWAGEQATGLRMLLAGLLRPADAAGVAPDGGAARDGGVLQRQISVGAAARGPGGRRTWGEVGTWAYGDLADLLDGVVEQADLELYQGVHLLERALESRTALLVHKRGGLGRGPTVAMHGGASGDSDGMSGSDAVGGDTGSGGDGEGNEVMSGPGEGIAGAAAPVQDLNGVVVVATAVTGEQVGSAGGLAPRATGQPPSAQGADGGSTASMVTSSAPPSPGGRGLLPAAGSGPSLDRPGVLKPFLDPPQQRVDGAMPLIVPPWHSPAGDPADAAGLASADHAPPGVAVAGHGVVGRNLGPWALAAYGESLTEARTRAHRRAAGPLLWAALAHNVAHWEAARRPRRLAPVLYAAARAAAAAGAGGQAADEPTALAAAVQASGATGLGSVVERAQLSALQSLTHACMALGSAQAHGPTAAAHLSALAHWVAAVPSDAGPALALYPGVPPASIGLTAGLSAAMDARVTNTEVARVLDGADQEGDARPGEYNRVWSLRVLLSRQAVTARQLIADPFVLILELLGQALTAHGLASGKADNEGDLPLQPPTQAAELLAAIARMVLPIAAVQTAAWVASAVHPKDTATAATAGTAAGAGGPRAAGEVSQWQAQVLAALETFLGGNDDDRVGGGVEGAEGRNHANASTSAAYQVAGQHLEAVAGHMLPLLMRLHVLHALLQHRTPEAPLAQRYACLAPSPTLPHAAPGACGALADAVLEALSLPPLLTVLRGASARVLADAARASHNGSGVSAEQQATPGNTANPPCAAPLLMHWSGHVAWAVLGTAAARGPATAGAAKGQGGATSPPVTTTPQWMAPPPSLIQLPSSFQDLFLTLTDQACHLCGKTVPHPCVCLLTGRLMCCMWRGCSHNRAGGLLHTMEACGGSTLLLALKTTKVLVLRPHRLTLFSSPYLDAHGEEDVDLRRGRPLYLNTHVYGQLAGLLGGCATEFDWHMLQASHLEPGFP